MLEYAYKIFSDQYYCYKKEDSILVLAEDKGDIPFLYIIEDDNYPKTLLLSFSIDYPYPSNACLIALELREHYKVLIAEDFYISKSGYTHWGDEARKILHFDMQLPLEEYDITDEVKH